MDATAELGRNPVNKHHIQPEYRDEHADAGRDGRPISREQIFRRERGQGSINFSCSADHEEDGQPYPVDPYSCYMYGHTYMCDHTRYPNLQRVLKQNPYIIGRIQSCVCRNASKPSEEHSLSQGEKSTKRLGGNIGGKGQNSFITFSVLVANQMKQKTT